MRHASLFKRIQSGPNVLNVSTSYTDADVNTILKSEHIVCLVNNNKCLLTPRTSVKINADRTEFSYPLNVSKCSALPIQFEFKLSRQNDWES